MGWPFEVGFHPLVLGGSQGIRLGLSLAVVQDFACVASVEIYKVTEVTLSPYSQYLIFQLERNSLMACSPLGPAAPALSCHLIGIGNASLHIILKAQTVGPCIRSASAAGWGGTGKLIEIT